jgi:DNA-directed RNA polymerase specialized sigma24 family protein
VTTLEDRLYRAIVLDFEGRGEAWTTDDSGDTLARAAAEVAAREVAQMYPVPPDSDDLDGLTDLGDAALLAVLPHAQAAIAAADSNVRRVVDMLRTRRVSYARIGEALGVSRQAAWERFTR